MKKAEKIFDNISCVLIVIMTGIIIIRVFMRFFFNITPSWSEELTALLMVWVTMLGLTIGIRDNTHLSMSVVYDRFSLKTKLFVNIINNVLILCFTAFVLGFNGIQMVQLTSRSRLSSIPVPNSVLYIMVPIAGIFSFLYALFLTYRSIKKYFEYNKIKIIGNKS